MNLPLKISVACCVLMSFVLLPAVKAEGAQDLLDEASQLLSQYQQEVPTGAEADRLNVAGLRLIGQLETCESDTEQAIARLLDIRTIEQLDAIELNQGQDEQADGGSQQHAGTQVVDQQLNQLTRQLVECRLKASQISQARTALVEQQRGRWLEQLIKQQDLWQSVPGAAAVYWGLTDFFTADVLWYLWLLLIVGAQDVLWRRQLQRAKLHTDSDASHRWLDWLKQSGLSLMLPLVLTFTAGLLFQAVHWKLVWLLLLALLARDVLLRFRQVTFKERQQNQSCSGWLLASSSMLVAVFATHEVWFYSQQAPELGPHNGRGFAVLMAMISILLIFTSRWLSRRLTGRGFRWLLWLIMLLAVAVLLLLLFSYARAAQYVLTLALGLKLVVWVATAVSGVRIAALRRAIGQRRQQDQSANLTFPFWITMAINLLLWLAALSWLSWLARVSDDLWQNIRFLYSEGFELGSVRIVPNNILVAVLLVTVLVLLLSRIKSGVENRWFNNSGLGKGSREVMSMVVWYCGLFIVIIIGLGVAGFDVTNLALIAGALSVGIGFGLQNIVSNFVSGLILLFERPVKNGDWVEVGDTVGLIEKVKIRATRIRTFDNAEILVPNSELLSHHVTNWTLSNSIGRITMKVGVAYGSDVQKVYDILDGIAKSHEQILQQAPYKHKVLFREFGDSSLDFELRVMIKDIKQILDVHSELNFAIERSLREAGITIPFPQRDVHLIEPASSAKDDQAEDNAQHDPEATRNQRSGSEVEDLVEADQDQPSPGKDD